MDQDREEVVVIIKSYRDQSTSVLPNVQVSGSIKFLCLLMAQLLKVLTFLPSSIDQ